MTIKHVLYNFLLFFSLILMHGPPFCWFSSVSVYENTLGRCCSPSSRVFQLVIYFQYQAISVFALTLQWRFLLLELGLVFFSPCCCFRRFWKPYSNTWISYTSYWILKREEDRNTSMRDMVKKDQSPWYSQKTNVGYLDITWTLGVVDIVQKIEGKLITD